MIPICFQFIHFSGGPNCSIQLLYRIFFSKIINLGTRLFCKNTEFFQKLFLSQKSITYLWKCNTNRRLSNIFLFFFFVSFWMESVFTGMINNPKHPIAKVNSFYRKLWTCDEMKSVTCQTNSPRETLKIQPKKSFRDFSRNSTSFLLLSYLTRIRTKQMFLQPLGEKQKFNKRTIILQQFISEF